jgi:hypothetical protein
MWAMERDQLKVSYNSREIVMKVQISRWVMRWDRLISWTARWEEEKFQTNRWAREGRGDYQKVSGSQK